MEHTSSSIREETHYGVLKSLFDHVRQFILDYDKSAVMDDYGAFCSLKSKYPLKFKSQNDNGYPWNSFWSVLLTSHLFDSPLSLRYGNEEVYTDSHIT